jgi:hypothetical protein
MCDNIVLSARTGCGLKMFNSTQQTLQAEIYIITYQNPASLNRLFALIYFYFGGIDASVIRMRTRPNSDLQKRLALWKTRSTQKYKTEKERPGCGDDVRADKHR